MRKLLYLFVFLHFCASNCTIQSKIEQLDKEKDNQKKVALGNRPFSVQAQVNKAFENIKYGISWIYNGSFEWYWLLGLDDERMIKNSVAHELDNNDMYIIDPGCSQDDFTVRRPAAANNDVYIIDVGGAKGEWGRNALKVLQNEEYKKTGKKFYIFSVTGGEECDDFVEQKGHVTLYQFNQFKIEDIDEELAKRGFDLQNKVNLIVSHWTLRHLVDPFGTLKRLYGLLAPTQGKLLSNGFLFKYDTSKQVESFPGRKENNENILANQNSNATLLFNEIHVSRDAGEFLLVRNNNKDIDIPLEYTGKTEPIGDLYQCASKTVTIYKKGFSPLLKFEKEYLENDQTYRKLYCAAQDVPCKKLYALLKKQGLFYK